MNRPLKTIANRLNPAYVCGYGRGYKSWIFRYSRQGKSREMGLGSLNAVSLEQARQRAAAQRNLLSDGGDPIAAREAGRRQDALLAANTITFDQCSAAYIEAHKIGWRNTKHAMQWTNTLQAYASPLIGHLPVGEVDTTLVMKVLDPIWHTKTETATRVRNRIELVLDWAKVRDYRAGENPARWRGHLDKLLPKRSKVSKVQHHAALPYSDAPAFVQKLRSGTTVTRKALEAVILTVLRVSEVVNAKKVEFDWKAKIWTVSAERMKSGRSHRVPLSSSAFKLFKAQADVSDSDYMFPGLKRNKSLSSASCLKLAKELSGIDITTHGFRSTFRDWAAEQSHFPREIAEAALAHVLADKTEAAYQRGDLLEKRRELMQAWSDYCGQQIARTLLRSHLKRRKRAA